MARLTIAQAGNVSRLAFLDMLAACEHDAKSLADPRTDDGYRILVGSTARALKLFDSYAAHPHVYNKALDSTAAGRYQIIWPTWNDLVAKYGFTDFTPESQDRAALMLIKQAGGLDYIDTGRIELAIARCREVWASLPGSSVADQPERDIPFCLHAYQQALVRYSSRPDFSNVTAGSGSTATILK